MFIKTAPDQWSATFTDLAHIVDWCERTPAQWDFAHSRTNEAKQSWDLAAGLNGALHMAKHGWEQGIRELQASVKLVPTQQHYVKEYNVAGEYPDVARAVSGDTFNMIKRGKQRKVKPALSIFVNITASASVTARAMSNYGAALVGIIDKLESRGIRVEVLAGFKSSLTNGKAGFNWTVKPADAALDLAAIAFGIAHPAMLRRVGFMIMERSPRHLQDIGYGYPKTFTHADIPHAGPDTLFINGVNGIAHQCTTVALATPALAKQLETAKGEPILELEYDQ